MQLISEEYRKLNSDKHISSKYYGTSGQYYLSDIIEILKKCKTQDVLDYGCGKNTLAHNLPFRIQQYDPAIPKYAALPLPADVVVCTDVLEHIEPEFIENVLLHLKTLTKQVGYLLAATIPAQKTLADGRNAHILLREAEWWEKKIADYFEIVHVEKNEAWVKFFVQPKEKKEKTESPEKEIVNA